MEVSDPCGEPSDPGDSEGNASDTCGSTAKLERSSDGPDPSEQEYREAIRCNPDDANAHFNLGLLLAKRGALEEAEEQYRQAIRCNPDDANAYFNLGLLLA